MKSLWIIACMCCCLAANTIVAQEYPRKEIDLERLADELFGFQDLDLNYEDLYENLALLLAQPLNINKASAEQLRFLNLLSEEQVQNLIAYRAEQGNLISIYELQSVPGFDLITLHRIAPFFIVDQRSTDRSLLHRMLHDGSNYFIVRYERTLETKKGFTTLASPEQQFQGDENKIYLRFRSSRSADYSFGFTAEKDAGEKIQWQAGRRIYGFDYTSAHLQLMNKGIVENIIIGDYQAQFGQGLLLGSNFGFGKGGETITTTRRSNLGFLPYTSLNETGYLRGGAITLKLHPNLLLSGMYSTAWRDATLISDSTEASFASAFQTTGLHRNIAELNRRQSINERQQGIILNYRKRNIEGGAILHHIQYGVPIQRSPQPYNQFTFAVKELTNAGAFLNVNINNFTWFTEAAKTFNHGTALVSGIIGSITPQLDVAIHYRYFARDFYSLYANAFAEGSLPQNERGLYWGWKYRLNRQYSIAGYADLFRFPWLRYRSYAPSDGHEFLFRFSYQPSRSVLVFAQVREESKARNLSGTESPLYLTANGIKRNFWLNCDYGLGQHLRLKTRAQFSTFTINDQTTYGMILLQEISYSIGKFSLAGRHALFDTDDFDNRQYVFERDVWLAYSIPFFSGTGLRNYLLIQYDVNNKLTFWIRYAHTRYTDRETIGSGADSIDGDSRNDVKLQMRLRL